MLEQKLNIDILKQEGLEDRYGKNLFAENTIKYIDTTLSLMENDLKTANNDLKNFSKSKKTISIWNCSFRWNKGN